MRTGNGRMNLVKLGFQQRFAIYTHYTPTALVFINHLTIQTEETQQCYKAQQLFHTFRFFKIGQDSGTLQPGMRFLAELERQGFRFAIIAVLQCDLRGFPQTSGGALSV